MSFSIGIIGLPNAGKSTLFQALTKKAVEIAPFVFSTRQPNIGRVAVPDKRLEKIAQLVRPEKITPTFIEFIDIAGLVKDAHKGEGLGNQFLAHIRECDAVVEVARGFHNPEIEHIEGSLDPKRDTEIVKTELLMKDLETLEKIEQKTEKLKNILEKVKAEVGQGRSISSLNLTEQEKGELKEYQFLTAKPRVLILNANNKDLSREFEHCLFLDLKLEQEISELSENEARELGLKSGLEQLITSCYNALGLISFFTIIGGKEARAWTLKKGSPALAAAGQVHSDFEKRFIRAEVISWQKLVKAGSWLRARDLGWIQTVGKDYLVQDGDVIEFKI